MHLAARPPCAVKGAARRSSQRSGDPLLRGPVWRKFEIVQVMGLADGRFSRVAA